MRKLELSDLENIVVPAELIAESVERKDFDVHLKYVRHVRNLSNGLSISHSLKPVINTHVLKELDSKLRVIERTNQLIEEEVRCIKDDAYAQACVAWLPAQVYYNLYHLLAIIEFIVTGEKVHLRISHEKCLKSLATRIAAGTVKFSSSLFNQTCNKTILGFRSQSGEVLSNSITDDRLVSLVMKKIATDKLEDFKARRGLDCRRRADKQAYKREENRLNISIVDFFYSMRIRTNYRDMSFLDDLDARRTRIYFLEYHEAAKNFYICLNNLKNDLITRMH